IAETARLLWLVYAGYTLLCIVCLKLAGMSWLDAVCHAFSTLSLGGFSTHDASISHFDSPAIELVITVFMLIAAVNFATHYTALHKSSLTAYRDDPETMPMLGLIAGSILLCTAYLAHFNVYDDIFVDLRYVSFNLVSIATDAGFANDDFDKWPPFVPWWMLFLSCITICTGSTGGGIKMFRALLMLKQAKREMFSILHPRAVNPIRIGNTPIPNKVIFAVLAFIFQYFISVVVMTFALIFTGLDPISSLSGIIACINNAGPGLNELGPATNYASLNDFQKWICAITMLLGRLEVFTLVVLFTPTFWRK
ncbi:MAG: potassium transporter TrkG, partial [Methylomonas sp.]|nr:potassium transporter TrkG [Methylomonas sp.]